MPIHHPLGFKQHPLEDAGMFFTIAVVHELPIFSPAVMSKLSLRCRGEFTPNFFSDSTLEGFSVGSGVDFCW